MRELRGFQREDVEFIKRQGHRVLIASAPGTGKTVVAIRALVEEYATTLPALVVCPASVVRNWAKEIKAWAPGVFVHCVEDTKTKIPFKKENAFYVISWDLLRLRWREFLRKIRAIVGDEAHFVKNSDALRTQAFVSTAEPLKRILLMTGTPIVNTVSDMNVLYQLLGSDNPPMIRRLLEDVAPDVPAKSRSYLRVSLKERDKAIYEHAKEEFEEWLRKKKEELLGEGMAEDEVERAMAAEALVKVGYLRRLVGEAKVAAAVEWISRAIRLGEPVVVFAEHQAVIKKLSVALKKQRIKFGVLDGATSVKARQTLVDDFQAHNLSVFIGSKAAKEGITLHAARHLLFVERFFTAAEEEQGEDRVRRIGQKFQTTIWFLHAPDTIDDRVDQIVRSKRQIVRTAIGAPHTAETDEGNVCALIRSWGEHVSAPTGVELGHSPPLPALPRARSVLEIVFSGPRWKGTSPKLWCQMNGYTPRRMEVHPDKSKVSITRYDLFRPNTFKVKVISKDIKMILGERLHFENKERIEKAIKRNQG